MIDPQEPRNGDFAAYVESLVKAPKGSALPPGAPGAVPTHAERKSARRAEQARRAGAGVPGAPTAGTVTDARAQVPEVLRKVLESRGGKETREAMEGLFRTAQTPGTGASAPPAELAGAAGVIGRGLTRVGSLTALFAVALFGVWIADLGIFHAFPDAAVPLLIVGMILRVLGAKLSGFASRNTA
ncbi:MAG TPA: hypothetical protein PLP74_12365 [Quisquiliibacterium sp.]|nr:hypothetical protein [Quisquiliibacterium sp.]